MPPNRLRVAVSVHSSVWRQLMRSRDFGWLWAGQVISQTGEGLAKVALLWFVYQLTGSALKMTMVGLLQTIPPLVFGPFAGAYLDRVPKRAAMIVIDSARAVLLVFIPILYWMNLLNLTGLYMLVFIIAMFSMAFGPTLNAAIPLIVKQEQLTSANAIMQSSVTVGQLVGPALSGVLIAVMGAQNVLYVNAGAFLVSVLCKIPMQIRSTRWETGLTSIKTMQRDLRKGVRFVFVQHKVLLLLMLVASLSFMASTGFIYLLPVIGKRILNADVIQLGWLWSSLGIGILITTVWLALQEEIELCRRLWLIAGATLIAGMAVFGLVGRPPIGVAMALTLVVGGSAGLVTPIVSAALQLLTPKALMARVFGVFNTGTMAFAMIGMTLFGALADFMTADVSVMGIGGATLVTALVTILLIPRCTRLLTKEPSLAG